MATGKKDFYKDHPTLMRYNMIIERVDFDLLVKIERDKGISIPNAFNLSIKKFIVENGEKKA